MNATEAQKRNIENLMARVGDLQKQLHDAESRLRAAQIEASGINIGDTVFHKGVEYQVTSVKPWDKSKPWVTGITRKKDGTFGTRAHCLYSDWTEKP